MDRRLELQKELEEVLGSSNVYFQPPENVKLKYPCIVYERSAVNDRFADDIRYKYDFAYSGTLISRSPNDPTIKKILETFTKCRFGTHFVVDNLHHDNFTIY